LIHFHKIARCFVFLFENQLLKNQEKEKVLLKNQEKEKVLLKNQEKEKVSVHDRYKS